MTKGGNCQARPIHPTQMRLQPGLTSIQLLTAVIQLLTTVPNDLGAHSPLVPSENDSSNTIFKLQAFTPFRISHRVTSARATVEQCAHPQCVHLLACASRLALLNKPHPTERTCGRWA